jgi:dipeptidyl aminopeptidase/acylaminoacyl peptidase
VSYAGVSDLIAFSQYAERLQGAELWKERLGASTRGLWQMSPMSEVRALETPLLLMHGRYDPVVPVSQTRRFARSLKQHDKMHRFIERTDCDHDMTLEPCREAFFTEMRAFLATWLGVPADPRMSR